MLKEYIFDQAKRGDWYVHPSVVTTKNEVSKAQEIMKHSIYNNYFDEIPYHIDIDVNGWTPKSNGELIVDFILGVNRTTLKPIIIGENGRIINSVRQEVAAALSQLYNRPVVVNVTIRVDKFYGKEYSDTS